MKKIKPLLISFLIDFSLWTYFVLCTYEIIFLNIIKGNRYSEFTWDVVYISLGVGAVLATLVRFIPTASVGKVGQGLSPAGEGPWYTKIYGIFGLLLLIVTFVAGLVISQVSMREFLSPQGLQGAKRIFTSLLSPNFAIFEPTLFAAVETIYMAFIATAFAIPVAFVLGFMAAQNIMKKSLPTYGIYNLIRFGMNLTRSIEPLVWAIIFSVWVGIGPFAGMMALFLHSVSSLTKLYSEQIEVVDEGPIEAMIATGANGVQVIWFGIVPQVFLPFLSYTIYRWDINVRMATIIGLVGGGGIGTMLMQYQGLAKWNEVGLIVMVIAFIVWAMDFLSARIRNSIK